MIALIDMDVENTYDQTSFVAFCQMLAGIRFGITFCPYGSVSFWVNSLAAFNQSNPGAVKWWNLQCYDGGNLNDPAQWAQAIVTKIRTFNPHGSSSPATGAVISRDLGHSAVLARQMPARGDHASDEVQDRDLRRRGVHLDHQFHPRLREGPEDYFPTRPHAAT